MNNLVSIINTTGTIAAIIFALFAFTRNKKKDDADDGKQNGTLMTEIGYIKKGIEDIQRKQHEQDKNYLDVVVRLTAVETTAKSAHKRIDTIEGRPPKKE